MTEHLVRILLPTMPLKYNSLDHSTSTVSAYLRTSIGSCAACMPDANNTEKNGLLDS